MKKDRKLNRISRKHDRVTICDRIRTEAPVGMNNELITHADNTKSLILKDDHKVAFAYVEMKDNVATIVAVPSDPFFFKARSRNLNRYLDIALSACNKIIGNSEEDFIQLQPHPKMDTSFTKTLQNITTQKNTAIMTSAIKQIMQNRHSDLRVLLPN